MNQQKPETNSDFQIRSTEILQKAKPSVEIIPKAPLLSERNNCQHLFEEFFVIGINELDLAQMNLEGENNENPEAKILFSFPDPVEKIHGYVFSMFVVIFVFLCYSYFHF